MQCRTSALHIGTFNNGWSWTSAIVGASFVPESLILEDQIIKNFCCVPVVFLHMKTCKVQRFDEVKKKKKKINQHVFSS